MEKISIIEDGFKRGRFNNIFEQLYSGSENKNNLQLKRYLCLIEDFKRNFKQSDRIDIYSTPGRTEVGGNHTDHNAGRVLAAAIDLDVIASVSKNSEERINIISEGYDYIRININDLDYRESEKFQSVSLVRGVCYRMKELGFNLGGFNAYIKSSVPKGSGLSSSAAFEVLIVTILNHLYNDGKIDDITNAQIAQSSENNFFGKPCGLMDQTTCAVGGFVTIDFKDFKKPVIEKIDFDFGKSGYKMAIIDTGGDHSDLTNEYIALENEMKAVAKALGGKVLREFSKRKVLSEVPSLRKQVNDRAVLRAIHFYDDDLRVVDQSKCLQNNDFKKFMELMIDSGESSWMLCQNCYDSNNINFQGIPIALAISENYLKDRGAWRVHGGGFQGTIQSIIPNEMVDVYKKHITDIFGENSYQEIIIRSVGSYKFQF